MDVCFAGNITMEQISNWGQSYEFTLKGYLIILYNLIH